MSTARSLSPSLVPSYHTPSPVNEVGVNLFSLFASVPFVTYPNFRGRFYSAANMSDEQLLSVLLCDQHRLSGYDQSDYWFELELERLFGVMPLDEATTIFKELRGRFRHHQELYDLSMVRRLEISGICRPLIVSSSLSCSGLYLIWYLLRCIFAISICCIVLL